MKRGESVFDFHLLVLAREKVESKIIEHGFVWTRDIALSYSYHFNVAKCIFFPSFVTT